MPALEPLMAPVINDGAILIAKHCPDDTWEIYIGRKKK